MSPRPVKHISFLRLVCNECCSHAQKKQLLRTASTEQVKTICECIDNVLKRNIPLAPEHLCELKKYKKVLYTLADRRVPIPRKKRIIEQSGGFLPALLIPIIGAILGGLAHNAITK
jgi:hypothetical protein